MAKKALLIGVNHYKMPGADLRGCVNDVKNMEGVLTKFCGFSSKDITTLLDDKATTKAMRSAIKSIVGGATKGDVVLVHFSGHGSNVPDKNGDEADNRDEILCPHDLDWMDPFLDDFLRTTFNGVKKGVSLTAVFDSCHSGTATRAILPPDAPIVPRYLPSPWDIAAAESGRKLRGTVRRTVRRSTRAARQKKDLVTADIPEVLLSGCRDTQTSADAHIGGSFNGALTYSLVSVLTESKGRISNRDLHTNVLARLKRDGFDQVPQLEGMKEAFDREFLAPIA
jgi:hypothetical protein